MKSKKLIVLISGLAILLTAPAFAQPGSKLMAKMLKKAAPAEPIGDEATIKMYSDAARTNEITTVEDGVTKLYFRAYIWKDRAKKGTALMSEMEKDYCFSFKEGEFGLKEADSGFDYGDVKSEVMAKSLSDYSKDNDYIDIEIDLKETQFLDYFVSRTEENKKFIFTARLEGECQHTLANSNFTVDLSNGKTKYDKLVLAANDDIEIPTCLYPNDKELHAKVRKLIYSKYKESNVKDIYFYKDWEQNTSTERWIQTMYTTQKDGVCEVHYIRTWSQLSQAGWMEPYVVSQLSTRQVSCDKFK
jgi:hypothetical protein